MRNPGVPHDVGAERAVLGAVLLRPDCYEDATRARLRVRDFYLHPHQLIWQTYRDLYEERTAIDIVTVAAKLDDQAKLDEIGGYSYLLGLTEGTPSTTSVPHYADIVVERSDRRRIITLAHEAIEKVHSEGADAALQTHSEGLRQLEDSRLRADDGPQAVGELADGLVQEARRALEEGPPPFRGVPTGIRDLDRLLGGGLRYGSLTIVGGRPAMGKSALALQMTMEAACAGFGALDFSLEMEEEAVAERILASKARVLYHRVQKRVFHTDDWPELISAVELLDGADFWVKYSPAFRVDEIGPAVRRLRRRGKRVDLVLVDYLQLMEAPRAREGERIANREQAIAANTRRLKILAGEMGLAVILVAQLNRGVEQRADKRPMMSDLRESGAAEQDADNILFVYRDEYYNENSEMKGIAELLVRKARGARVGDVKTFWRGEYQRFENLASEEW